MSVKLSATTTPCGRAPLSRRPGNRIVGARRRMCTRFSQWPRSLICDYKVKVTLGGQQSLIQRQGLVHHDVTRELRVSAETCGGTHTLPHRWIA